MTSCRRLLAVSIYIPIFFNIKIELFLGLCCLLFTALVLGNIIFMIKLKIFLGSVLSVIHSILLFFALSSYHRSV